MDLWAFTPFIRFFCDFVAEAFYISLQYIRYDLFYCKIVATDLTLTLKITFSNYANTPKPLQRGTPETCTFQTFDKGD